MFIYIMIFHCHVNHTNSVAMTANVGMGEATVPDSSQQNSTATSITFSRHGGRGGGTSP